MPWRARPVPVEKRDAVDWLSDWKGPRPGRLTVLFHTIAWQYLPKYAQEIGDELIARHGERASQDAPMARFTMEAAGAFAALRLQRWPEGIMMDLGRADYHGRWVAWEAGARPEGDR